VKKIVSWALVIAATAAAAGVGAVPASATAGTGGGSGDGDNASCMGLGSSFYGTFAQRQRAFVAAFVIDQAETSGGVPGDIIQVFAREKEGGSVPEPCGTRIE
jgi:hypothetical protein